MKSEMDSEWCRARSSRPTFFKFHASLIVAPITEVLSYARQSLRCFGACPAIGGANPKNDLRMNVYLAEFVGTALLILFGNGVVANMVLAKTKGNGGGWICITAGWGFAVA